MQCPQRARARHCRRPEPRIRQENLPRHRLQPRPTRKLSPIHTVLVKWARTPIPLCVAILPARA
eukprot:153493-Rhodomonas_salina.1